MTGWIKIHRRLKEHWLWQDAEKLRWWIDLLLEVNHEPRKVLIKGKLIECGRGQSVKSLENWAQEWRTTKKTVRTFFLLLEKESMVRYESVTVTTRITVCNYESYQETGNSKETQSKRTVNAEETHATPKQESKELKEDSGAARPSAQEDKVAKRKEREKIFYGELVAFVSQYGKEMIRAFYDYWTEPNASGVKMRWEMEKAWDLQRRLNTWQANECKFSAKKSAAADVKPKGQHLEDANEILKRRYGNVPTKD